MAREAEVLKQARSGANISLSEMAELVGLDEAQVSDLENGIVEVSTEQLDRYARVFGLSLPRFLSGGAVDAPPAVLFRSLQAEGPSFTDLLETGACNILGEFLRSVADVAELESALGQGEHRIVPELDGLIAEEVMAPPDLFRQAERLALDVRERLGLGLEPVPSMIELVQGRLGISIFWVGPDDLDSDIDGASAYAPTPAILVNLIGGAELWWRSRMTLAHELCHLLYDLHRSGAAERTFLFSPHRGEVDGTRRRGLRLPTELEQKEQRANAFAAHFLAPPDGVKTTVGTLSPVSDEAINAVCRRFQIGRMTAVNQITNTYRLSNEDRFSMLARRPSDLLPKQHADAGVFPGLRAGRIRELVVRACEEDRIGNARARQFLGLSSSDPLPLLGTLSETRRAPMHSQEQRARLAAQRFLATNSELGGCYIAQGLPEGDRFRFKVEYVDEERWNAPVTRGYIIVSAGLEIQAQIESPARGI